MLTKYFISEHLLHTVREIYMSNGLFDTPCLLLNTITFLGYIFDKSWKSNYFIISIWYFSMNINELVNVYSLVYVNKRAEDTFS